jgi:ribosomal protein S18 acetylase RimI-like enzyme
MGNLMDIKVRPGVLGDCEACAQLSRIEELDSPGIDYAPAEFFAAHIDDDEMFLVAEVKSKVIGYIVGQPMKGDWAYISLLTVNPEMRGQGIGKMLIGAILDRCVARGFSYVTLFAPKFNKRTLGFYRSRGFTEGKDHVHFGFEPANE